MNLLKVAGIRKQEGGRPVLQGVSFAQNKFQKIAIAGESGSGKSTLLKAIAGLVQPDEGEVLFEQERVRGPYEKLIPGHPGIAYLSQHFELRNNYRVEELLEYANTLPATDADTLYDVCRIKPFLKRRTDQLSGGEKQRIAMARLLIGSPRLLLLDEPFSNLDQGLREKYRVNLKILLRQFSISTVYVTHDHVEALILADRLAVMNRGRIEQVGSYQEIYERPRTAFVAGFLNRHVGTPPISFVDARYVALPPAPGNVQVGIRPEDVEVSATDGPGRVMATITGTLSLPMMMNATILSLQVGQHEVCAQTAGDESLRRGDQVWLTFKQYHLFDIESGARLGSYPDPGAG